MEFCELTMGVDELMDGPAPAEPQSRGTHLPVMLSDVMDTLEPLEGLRIVDGTFGAGGYSRSFLANGAQVIAIDQDPGVAGFARALEKEFGPRFEFVAGRFSEMDQLVPETKAQPVDAVVLDIGVSSMQLDQPERGFSFLREGPLDMRMSGAGQSAADMVNTCSERELADLIFMFGEERKSRRIAKAIVEKRAATPIVSTLQLAELIEKTIGRKPGSNHPATRSFQALRIAVNGEMDELVEGLFAAERLLQAGGRLLVVTFHSLEDRIVKRFFDGGKSAAARSRHLPPVPLDAVPWSPVAKARKASKEEVAHNPRARSAILRVGVRTNAAPRKVSRAGLGVPGSAMRGAA